MVIRNYPPYIPAKKETRQIIWTTTHSVPVTFLYFIRAPAFIPTSRFMSEGTVFG